MALGQGSACADPHPVQGAWGMCPTFSRRLKSAFFGLRPRVGLRRPLPRPGAWGMCPTFSRRLKLAFLGLRPRVGPRRPPPRPRGLGDVSHFFTPIEIGLLWPAPTPVGVEDGQSFTGGYMVPPKFQNKGEAANPSKPANEWDPKPRQTLRKRGWKGGSGGCPPKNKR